MRVNNKNVCIYIPLTIPIWYWAIFFANVRAPKKEEVLTLIYYYTINLLHSTHMIDTKSLKKYGRSGVPFYLYWEPGYEKPKILPAILTDQIIINNI